MHDAAVLWLFVRKVSKMMQLLNGIIFENIFELLGVNTIVCDDH